MSFPKQIRWLFYGAAGLAGLLLILLAILTLVGISINLEGKKALIEKIVTNAVNRPVSIDGKIQLTTSLWPVVTIEGVRIANPEQFQTGDFARLESTRIRIGLVSLLSGKLHVRDLSIDGLHLALKKDEDGAANWIFSLPSAKTTSSDSIVVDMISLNRISVSYLDRPPVPVKEARAMLSIQKDNIDLTDLKIILGSSELAGKISLNKTGKRPRVDIDLKSPLFQIDDFNFTGLTPGQETAQTPENPAAAESADNQINDEEPQTETEEPIASYKDIKLINPEIRGYFDAKLKISADKVLSGKDQLGSGQIIVKLEDGRISIDPLQLNLPDGSFLFNLSIKDGHEDSDSLLKIKIENFDFGVLARRHDPQTDIGGMVNFDADLKSPAQTLFNFLSHATGYIDFSVYPENWRSGVINLPSVNLIAGIASHTDKNQSDIECLIGRWSLLDGVLNPDIFVVDTSRMRICCNGSVDFNKNELNLKVAPAPKKPEYLSYAVPIGVRGTFSDVRLGIASLALAETSLKFAISPAFATLKKMFTKSIPADGSDVCAMPLGPERPTSPPAGCR